MNITEPPNVTSLEEERVMRIFSEFLTELNSFIKMLSEHTWKILDKRILADKPQTYKQIAGNFKITSEGIRRKTVRLDMDIKEKLGYYLQEIVGLLKKRLKPIVPAADIDLEIEDLFIGSTVTVNLYVESMAYRFIWKHLNYTKYGDLALSRSAVNEVEKLRAAARELANDTSIIDQKELFGTLSNNDWESYWDVLLDCAGIVKIGGQIALKRTNKSRIAAALLDMDRPATKTEIANVSGLPEIRITNYLASIPGIVRVDKNRWDFAENVDEEYEGIAAGITKLIDESGGAAPLVWIMDEMQRRFGSKEGSIRSFVGAPQFVVENDYVKMADLSQIEVGDLEEVITGRTTRGEPYWTFTVKESYFRGYSLTGFPTAIAAKLGCVPGGKISAKVLYPFECGELSVIWNLHSLTGPYLGLLSEPLRKLNAKPGMNVDLVIIGKEKVELTLT